ncbi:MAG: nitroreductase family protein, partial [Thermococcus sp.]|nr:nitroreductase family protein [Thermococcus sp.]
MELDDAIMKRSSVRYFLEKSVPEEDIKKLIEAAIRAPTA